MPQVGNKHYPYTREGMAAAAAARGMQAGGMAIPKGSPPEAPRYPRSRGPRLPGGHGKGPKWAPKYKK